MGAFFIYVFKSAMCLIFFYLFFRLLLSKETFHRFNRIALLGALCLSWLIPWIDVTIKQQIEVNQAMLSIEQLLMMVESASIVPNNTVGFEPETTTISWIQITLLVYLLGILFFICRNIYSLFSLVRLLLSGKRERLDNGIILVIHEKEIAPFSWIKYIVISRKDLEENGREILIHEMAHIQNRHSWDLLIAEICIFFQWFNPSAWLLKQELQNIHEYEADETVIKKGVNAKEYQLLLIKKAVGTRLYSMANSFNHSKLKKRITMMLKEKSNPWARLKYLYVLPLATIAVTAFARPEVSKTVEEISAVKVNDLVSIVEMKSEQNTLSTPVDTTNRVVIIGGRHEYRETKDTTNHVVIIGGRHEYKDTKDSTLMITAGDKIVSLKGISKKQKPMVLINGKESDYAMVETLTPEWIESIAVMTGDKAVPVYGEKAKNGLLIIQLHKKTNKLVTVLDANRENHSSGKPLEHFRIGGINLYKLPENERPLIIIDGKESSDLDAFYKLLPERIKSFSILKDKSGTEVYGDKGRNGVILITLLTEEEYQDQKNNPKKPYANAYEMAKELIAKDSRYTLLKEKNLIFYIDGKEVSVEDVQKLSTSKMQSITINEDKERDAAIVRIRLEVNAAASNNK